jgi:glycosidase
MNSPGAAKLVYEINTRCWLRELSDAAGHSVTLGSVPARQFDRWAELGFTHIWAMGVWKTGPLSRALARAQPSLRQLCAEFFPDWSEDDLDSSPYAVADYTVSEILGGDEGLRKFREQLRARGMGLLLDFVPNHVGLDHPWIAGRPELLVQGVGALPEVFPVRTVAGLRWIAHGRDPYFPPWNDTAQLDYRNPRTRTAMIDALKSVAGRCDGVRCDMAMLVLNEVFEKTWAHFPVAHPPPASEFWTEAIRAVRAEQPEFLFLAEAYWDLEPKLQHLGFDYCYDKQFYDFLIRREFLELGGHLAGKGAAFHGARFLENHDEPRIAAILAPEEQQAAALLLIAQPGLRLLYDGQLTGRTRRTPVQLTRYLPETPNPKVTDFYNKLLAAFARENAARDAVTHEEILPIRAGVDSAPIFVNQWTAQKGQPRLSAVNMNSRPVEIRVELKSLPVGRWSGHDLLENNASPPKIHDGQLELSLPSHGGRLIEFRETGARG